MTQGETRDTGLSRASVHTLAGRSELVKRGIALADTLMPRIPVLEVRKFSDCHSGPLAFSPDGSSILVGGDDRILRLLDVSTACEVTRFVGHTEPVDSVSFSPDGRLVASGGGLSEDKFVDDNWVHVDGNDFAVRLWDAATGDELGQFVGHTDWVSSVAFSPRGSHVATGSFDGTVRVWGLVSRREVRCFSMGEVCCVAFSPDGRYLLAGGLDEQIHLWDIETGVEVRTFAAVTDFVESIAFFPDGKHFVVAERADAIRLHELQTGREIRRFGAQFHAHTIALSPDGRYLLAGSGEYEWKEEERRWVLGVEPSVRLWDVKTGQEVYCFSGHRGVVVSLAFSPNGLYAASVDDRKDMRLWVFRPQMPGAD